MLSSGEKAPDSMFRIRNTGIASSANCGIELAMVASRMPSEVMANR